MSAFEWANKAFEIAKTMNNADLLVELAQMKADYADRLGEIANLKEEVVRLEAERREFEDRGRQQERLTLGDGVYWDGERPQGDMRAQPLCPACWDDKGKKIHMVVDRGDYQDDTFDCPICLLSVRDPRGTPKEKITQRYAD